MATPTRLAVHYLPQFIPQSDLAGATVVVIDQLRASSTVCTALAAGAAEVVPLAEIDHALHAADGAPRDEILLGGERRGERIDGFDLGNSPSEYTPERVFGKRILFTTTNGTRAIEYAHLASRIVMGCALNAAAVATHVARHDEIHLLCAGTDGHVSRDDLLAAGLIVDRLRSHSDQTWELNEGAEATHREWQELVTTAGALDRTLSQQLAIELRETQGGQNLLDIGHDDDLVICAQIDLLKVVPELDPARGCLVAGGETSA